MSWLRKPVLATMALLMAWTTAASFACAFSLNQVEQPACCRNMAADCAQMMSADNPCCQIGSQSSVAEVMPPFSPEQSHNLLLALHSADARPVFDAPVALAGLASHRVPSVSPGSSTILRI